jgi:sulfonate dioxygenase
MLSRLLWLIILSNIRSHGHYGGEYHGDHSYEVNPPSYTLLRLVKTPPSGGDTIFTSQTALFDKLSPTFQKAFEGLHAIHSSDVSLLEALCVWYQLSTNWTTKHMQRSYLASINGGGKPHRAPIATAHPLVGNHYLA